MNGRKQYYVYYYQVKPEFDGTTVCTKPSAKHRTLFLELVGGELLSPVRVKRYQIPQNVLRKVRVKSTSVYWFFGARFSTELE